MQHPVANYYPTHENGARRSLASLDVGRWTLDVGRSGLGIKRWFLLAAATFVPSISHACAVCGGATDEHIVQASNTVLWALLGLVGFVFAATGATIWFLWRKAIAPIPPHIALIESLSGEERES